APFADTHSPHELELPLDHVAGQLLLQREQPYVQSSEPAPALLGFGPGVPRPFEILRELALDFGFEVVVGQRDAPVGLDFGLGCLGYAGWCERNVTMRARRDQRP